MPVFTPSTQAIAAIAVQNTMTQPIDVTDVIGQFDDAKESCCSYCDMNLDEKCWNSQIFIFTRGDEEQILCQFCAEGKNTDDLNRDGWVRDDQDEDDLVGQTENVIHKTNAELEAELEQAEWIAAIIAENKALKAKAALADETKLQREKRLKKIRDTRYNATPKGKATRAKSYENQKDAQKAYNATPERRAAQAAHRANPENKAKRALKAKERHTCTCGHTWTCADKARHMKSKKHLDGQKVKDMEAQLAALTAAAN